MNSICPVCRSKAIHQFLFRELFPVNDNLIFRNQEDAVNINKGNLNIVFCEQCGLVFNQDFDPNKVDYGEYYEYNIDKYYSPTFSQHLERIVNYLVFEKEIQNCNIVEVGCGSGSFLKQLVETKEFGNRGYGFDTTYTGSTSELEGRLKFEKRYYGSDCTNIPADVVIFRHVIEHIPNPIRFLEEIRQALVNSPHARVFCETPCVEWTLQNKVFWDFFYEHCLYFNAASLTTAFETAGFQVNLVKHIYEGQYLWLEANVSSPRPKISKKAGSVPYLAQEFSQLENDFKQNWTLKIQELIAKDEKIAIWGAGGKGTTFLNLIDPNRQWISCVVDINPKKQGTFIGGTGHPIINYEKLKDFGISCAIVINANYFDEIDNLLKKASLNFKLINAML